MHSFRFDCTGADSLLLARILVFLKALFAMELFKTRPEQLSQDLMQQSYDRYVQTYEGGKYGDRNQIALRKLARQDMVEKCQKIIHFLESVANDSDLTMLQNAGIKLRKPTRKKTAGTPKVILATAGGTNDGN